MMASLNVSPRGQPFLRAPGIVLGLIAGLLLIEAMRQFVFPFDEILAQYAFIPARYSTAYLAAHHSTGGSLFDKALPFVTYMFLHASWMHVLVNSVWLLPFGSIVARRYGSWPFLALFLVCGVAGAASELAANWGAPFPVIGASAAVSGLMGAAFRMMDDGPMGRLTPLLSSKVLIWSAVWTAVNVVAGVTGLGAGPGIELVAWQAHLGGYFAGLLLAGPLDALQGRNRP